MASQTTYIQNGTGRTLHAIFDAVRGYCACIGSALVMSRSFSARFQRFEALQAKSDAELAALNIRREDIVNHVFQDLYYS